ncbi:MAG: hypothetical protein ACHQM6_00240 [Candidatus Kapaibacterium sp.]
MRATKGTPAELTVMANLNMIGATFGMIGGLGILITGGALTGIESYKWFAFSEFPWLAWKQVIYVVILIINFSIVMPASKKMSKLIAEKVAAGGQGGASDEIRALGARIGMFAPLMNILALVNMVLGTSKGIF